MIKIFQENGNLIISSDSDNFLSPIIKNVLTRSDFGFYFDNEKKIYQVARIDDEKFFDRVYKFLLPFDKNISLDDPCEKLKEKNKIEREGFEQAVKEALKIKKNPKDVDDFEVPRMRDKSALKWYQKMPVAHSVILENSANFAVPGSGKTWMAYSTFFLLKEKKIVNKLLVVAPIAAFKPWEVEYEEMTGKKGKILRLMGTPNERYLKFRMSDQYEIFLVSYSTAGIENHMIQEILLKKDDFMMVVDESHNIKNFGTQRTTNVLKLGKEAKRRMILTGTMMPRSLGDIWTQFQFLYPNLTLELLGSRSTFNMRIEEPGATKRYSEILSPYFTRISEKTLDLPPVEFNPTNNGNPHTVEMGPVQRRIYDAIKGKIGTSVDQFRNDSEALSDYVKKAWIYLIEISIDPALIKHNPQPDSPELEALQMNALELLEKYPRLKDEPRNKYKKTISLAKETLDKNGKVLIWTNFKISAKKLGDYFNKEGYKCVTITGAVPRDAEVNPTFNRESELEKFKNNDDCNVLIAIPASLAESVSLHKQCHHAIYVDRTYNGGHYMQSLKRIHRVGLKDITTRYDIIESKDCIDQEIAINLAEKKRNLDAFYNNSELVIQNLDTPADSEDGEDEYTKLNNYENYNGSDDDFENSKAGILEHLKK